MRAYLLMALVGCLLLPGCRSRYHQLLVGEWRNTGEELTIEFKKSGLFKLSGPRGALEGNYSSTYRDYVDLTIDKKETGWALRVPWYGQPWPGQSKPGDDTGTLVFEYKFSLSNDQKTLTLTDRDGKALTFQRLP
ncbi:MAG TPA: hypothetical protein VFA18_18170 [Gemmataceae bacterium]|nr:hypothetical protein [Gemmataceae bacterium]